MTRREALRSYTVAGAQAAFLENELGTLAPGRRADFIMVDRDLLRCTDAKLLGAKVLQTWIEGERVFEYSGER